MQDYERLRVWKRTRKLIPAVYHVSGALPKLETNGLSSQMRSAAISIAANIAEGSARATDQDFARFLYISLGSAAELRCHLLLCNDLGYHSDSVTDPLLDEIEGIMRMLDSLVSKIVGRVGADSLK